MINFDDPSIAFALLAIIAGLRLALYVVERSHAAQPAVATTPVISPDDVADAPTLPSADLPSQQPEKQEASHYRFMSEVLEAAFIAILLVSFLIRPLILTAFFIPTESMVPTLQKGDKLLATKFTFHLREPRRQEIVVFRAPQDAIETSNQVFDPKHPVDYVKRVIGLPGDHIRIVAKDGVYVNGVKLQEPYLAQIPDYDYPTDKHGLLSLSMENERYLAIRSALKPHITGDELVVPPRYYFVLGDNRNLSHDSHKWGLLPKKALIGKALCIFWPPKRMGLIH